MKLLGVTAPVGPNALSGPHVTADAGKVIEGSGDRVHLFGALPALGLHEPFHVAHGFGRRSSERNFVKAYSYFVLIVDDVVLAPTGVGCRPGDTPENPGDCLVYLYDFPEGFAGHFPGAVAGSHRFKGEWYTTGVGSLYLPSWGSKAGCEGTPSWNPTLLASQREVEIFFTE